jgi:LysR family cys regulon transcriptional activator
VKLQQLRYLVTIVHQRMNMSAAADTLYTSQPGISKQIRLLEDELGVELLTRSGKHLTGLTPVGELIFQRAEEVLQQVSNIQLQAAEYREQQCGHLSIATTHTQARYALPSVIRQFRDRYPKVAVQIHQGSPTQIAQMAVSGQVEFAIATEALELFEDLVMLPCYRWNRSVIMPLNHPLARVSHLTLAAIAEYPLVTYVFGFTGRSQLDVAFRQQQLQPNVVLTATDADVIKTYVRIGLGIGIIARMAHDPTLDTDLVRRDADHLFASSVTSIGFRRSLYLREFMYEFIALFAPHLSADRVVACQRGDRSVLMGLELPCN